MKTLIQEILQFLRNNQDKEFKMENIRDEMWNKFAPQTLNGYAYFIQSVQHEIDDLVNKKK